LKETVPEFEKLDFKDEILDCEACRIAKMTKVPHKSVRYRVHKALMLVHTDTLHVSPEGRVNKSRYVVTFTDDYTRYTFTYNLVKKVQVGSALKNFFKNMRAKMGSKDARIHFLRLDGGTEYLIEEVKEVIKKEGTFLDVSSTGTSEMNGVVERVNRMLMRMAIVMLVDSGLPAELWELAMAQATQIHNKVPHQKLGMKSPYVLLHNQEPSRKFIYHFGCKAYTLIPYVKKKT